MYLLVLLWFKKKEPRTIKLETSTTTTIVHNHISQTHNLIAKHDFYHPLPVFVYLGKHFFGEIMGHD